MVAGDSTLTCNADTGVSPGFWVGTYPICHQIQCTPPLIPDATISPASGPYYYPDSIVITCNTGYSITSGKLICRLTEISLGYSQIPYCRKKFCRHDTLIHYFRLMKIGAKSYLKGIFFNRAMDYKHLS